MKKFLPLIFLSILFLQSGSCKPEGKGKLMFTLESYPPTLSLADRHKTTELLKKRLAGIGIDEDDIVFSQKGLQIGFTISGISNYPPDLAENIRRVLSDGNIELWETFSLSEIVGPLMDGLGYNDSDYTAMSNKPWNKFSSMIAANGYSYPDHFTCELGYVKVKDTASMNRLMDTAYRSKKLPYNFRHAWSIPKRIEGQLFCNFILLKTTNEGKARMVNPEFSKVELGKSEDDYEELSFQMTGFDTQLWKKMTRENIKKQVAIVVDGIVYTWPNVQSEIDGGVFSITGPADPGGFEKLKVVLETGRFPVPLHIVEEKVIQ